MLKMASLPLNMSSHLMQCCCNELNPERRKWIKEHGTELWKSCGKLSAQREDFYQICVTLIWELQLQIIIITITITITIVYLTVKDQETLPTAACFHECLFEECCVDHGDDWFSRLLNNTSSFLQSPTVTVSATTANSMFSLWFDRFVPEFNPFPV